MKNIIIAILLVVFYSSSSVYAKADHNIARNQLMQATQKFVRKAGIQQRQLSDVMQKVRTLSATKLIKAIREMQGRGVRLGENDPKVTGQLANMLSSYSNKQGAIQGHMGKIFGRGKTGNGMSNSLQAAMSKQKKGGSRTEQQSGILGDIYDWIFKTPDQAYADKQKNNRAPVYGAVNAPAGCLTTGCPETPNPDGESDSGSNNAYNRKSNMQSIDARLGIFGAKQRQKSTGYDIDPRTGKKVAKKIGPSNLEMYGNPNPNKNESSGNVSEESQREAKRKATQERLKQ